MTTALSHGSTSTNVVYAFLLLHNLAFSFVECQLIPPPTTNHRVVFPQSLPQRTVELSPKYSGEPSVQNKSHLQPRFINPFNLFGTSRCIDGGLEGVCNDWFQCLVLAGRIGRICRGFKGICCRFVRTCGQRTSQEVAYFNSVESKKSFFHHRSNRLLGLPVEGRNSLLAEDNFVLHARQTESRLLPGVDVEAEPKKGFADRAGCDFRVVKRNSDFCGVGLETQIDSSTSVSASPTAPGTQATEGCTDTVINVIGLKSKVNLPLCTFRDASTTTYYKLNISDVEEIRLSIKSLARSAQIPVSVKLRQIRCDEFHEEDLLGQVTGGSGSTGGIGGTGGTIIIDGTDGTEAVVIGPDGGEGPVTESGIGKPPAPPPEETDNTCGVRKRQNEEEFEAVMERLREALYNQRRYNSLYKRYTGEPVVNQYRRGITALRDANPDSFHLRDVVWNVPQNEATIFNYYMGEESIINQKIANGKITKINEFPWQVAMFVRPNKFTCGASLIKSQYVLTAAHCVRRYKNNPGEITLVLGDWDIGSDFDNPIVRARVQDVRMHPNYQSFAHAHDIAVLKLTAPVNFAPNIRPVCLPTTDMNLVNKLVTVSGWGRDENKKPLTQLHKMQAAVVTNQLCAERWNGPSGLIIDSMLCLDTQSSDSCNGDSGGPAVLEDPPGSGKFIQVGLVSFGSATCTVPDLPGVYTRLSSFRSWIDQQTRF